MGTAWLDKKTEIRLSKGLPGCGGAEIQFLSPRVPVVQQQLLCKSRRCLINYLWAGGFLKGQRRGRHSLRSCIDFGRAEAPVSAELSPQWFGRRNLYLWNVFTSAVHPFILFLVPLVNNAIGLGLFSLFPIHIFPQWKPSQGNQDLISVPQICCGLGWFLLLPWTTTLQLKSGQFHPLPLKSKHLSLRVSSFLCALWHWQAIDGLFLY